MGSAQEISEGIAEGVTLSGAGQPAGLCADDTLENPGKATPGAEGAKPGRANLSGKRTEAMGFFEQHRFTP